MNDLRKLFALRLGTVSEDERTSIARELRDTSSSLNASIQHTERVARQKLRLSANTATGQIKTPIEAVTPWGEILPPNPTNSRRVAGDRLLHDLFALRRQQPTEAGDDGARKELRKSISEPDSFLNRAAQFARAQLKSESTSEPQITPPVENGLELPDYIRRIVREIVREELRPTVPGDFDAFAKLPEVGLMPGNGLTTAVEENLSKLPPIEMTYIDESMSSRDDAEKNDDRSQ